MASLKIALVESVPFPPAEGLGNYVWNLSQQLVARGHQVDLFTRGTSQRLVTREHEGVRVHEAYAPPYPPIHVHLHRKHLQRALDLHAADVDVVHLHAPLPPPLRTRAPQLLTFHTPIRSSVANLGTWDKRAILERLQSPIAQSVERSLIRRATMISAVSPSVASDLAAYGLDPKSIHILDNGIDPTIFKPGTKPREDFLLVTGRLSPRKGLPDLLDALAELKTLGLRPKLVITGKGPLRPYLESRAARLGISDQVEFKGFVSRDELVQLLQTCAVFTFPSHYEGLPTSVLEAMACGAPIVAAAAHGTIDLIHDGENGYLVGVGSPGGLAGRLQSLIHHDTNLQRIGRAAQRTVEERFAGPRVAEQISRTYEGLANDRVSIR